MLHLFAKQQYRACESIDSNIFTIQYDEASRDSPKNSA
jgi:hypothetical protein